MNLSSGPQGEIPLAHEYPDIAQGTPVPHGGPGSESMMHEAHYIEKKLANISDVDLYRVYRDRWANPDRVKPNSKTLRPDGLNNVDNARVVQNRIFQERGRLHSSQKKDPVAEYQRDHEMLELERLIQYMLNPEEEMLSEEAVFEALFPSLDPHKNTQYEMWKFKMKTQEVHPYVFGVWENVKAFYARDEAFENLLFQEEEPVGGMPYLDPVKSYKYHHDPVHALLRSAYGKAGDLLDRYNPEHRAEVDISNLYDHDLTLHLDHMKKKYHWSPPPKSNDFYEYAKAQREIAKEERDEESMRYWGTMTGPFEYNPHPRGRSGQLSPMEHEISITTPRPVFIEIPDLQFVEMSTTSTNAPKYNSRVVFDYVAYPRNEPKNIIDSTYRLGQPITSYWGIDNLPKCLTMTLKLVPEGSRVHVTCPPRLLFGDTGWPQRGYPAHREITFDIIMREVTKPLPSQSWLISSKDNDYNESQY